MQYDKELIKKETGLEEVQNEESDKFINFLFNIVNMVAEHEDKLNMNTRKIITDKQSVFFNLNNPLFYYELKDQIFNIFRENNLAIYQAEAALELLTEDLKNMRVI